jgi:hypothetical protein
LPDPVAGFSYFWEIFWWQKVGKHLTCEKKCAPLQKPAPFTPDSSKQVLCEQDI